MTTPLKKTLFEKFVRTPLICEAKLSPQQADEKQGKIKAIATTFGPRVTEDNRKFYYTSEGFAQWADEMNAGGFMERPLPMFINHMSENLPVGEWTHVECSDECMEIEGHIYTETQQGKDLMNIMMRNSAMMPAVSISAYADEARMVNADNEEIMDYQDDDEEAYFQITKGGLSEVSVVMHPANPKAEIKSLEKFLNNAVNPRYLEKSLRDAGFKSSDAKKVCALLKKEELLREEVAPKTIEDIAREEQEIQQAKLLNALNEMHLINQLKKWK